MKLLIIGHARHGKDTFADLLKEFCGITSKSSSEAASEIFLYQQLKSKWGYNSPEECFNDRVNHREEWYKAICDYNTPDKTRLSKDIINIADCYVGMRDKEEFLACKEAGLFDLIIWVDASERLANESKLSFNIDKVDADIIIENNSDLESLKQKAIKIGKFLKK
jgi:dephospho-CoA kinase